MGKNRDKLSIIADILKITDSGSSKTRIMFLANLSFKLLEKYLDVVISSGFVRVDGSTYYVTDHGRDFLKRYKHFHNRFKKAQGRLEALVSEQKNLAQLCEKHAILDPIKLVSSSEFSQISNRSLVGWIKI